MVSGHALECALKFIPAILRHALVLHPGTIFLHIGVLYMIRKDEGDK